jgi:hypothetical protein
MALAQHSRIHCSSGEEQRATALTGDTAAAQVSAAGVRLPKLRG